MFYEATVHNKCSRCPPFESVRAWIGLFMDCRKFQRSRGRREWFGTPQQCIVEVSVHFQMQLNKIGVF